MSPSVHYNSEIRGRERKKKRATTPEKSFLLRGQSLLGSYQFQPFARLKCTDCLRFPPLPPPPSPGDLDLDRMTGSPGEREGCRWCKHFAELAGDPRYRGTTVCTETELEQFYSGFFFSIFQLLTVTQNFEFCLECCGYLIALFQ